MADGNFWEKFFTVLLSLFQGLNLREGEEGKKAPDQGSKENRRNGSTENDNTMLVPHAGYI